MEEDNSHYRKLTAKDFGRPPQKQHEILQSITKPHVESFNYVLRQGLKDAVTRLLPLEFELPPGKRCSISVVDAVIGVPMVSDKSIDALTLKLYPAECRERRTTYQAKLQVSVQWSVDGQEVGTIDRTLGEIPIMVKSAACNLANLSPEELIKRGEEPEEMGGYFIVNGNEKVIRMITMPRRNYPLCIARPSWKGRGTGFTEYGVSVRSVATDQTATTVVLHYLSSGSVAVCFPHNKEHFFVPLVIVMKALLDVTDKYVYTELTRGRENNAFYKGCISGMLRQARVENMSSRPLVLRYIGKCFRIRLRCPPWYTDMQVADFLLKQCLLIQFDNNQDKFNLLVHMTQKLFAFAKGECAVENADNPMFQEVLLPGHLYLTFLKEKLYEWLVSIQKSVMKKAETQGSLFVLDTGTMNAAFRQAISIPNTVSYLLSTGNIISRTGLGLMQASGLAIVADKLNFYRYLSHFHSVHRGSYFTEMRTTAVRKLLPEAWGFICPVHTPDGSPCGLLNHLAGSCQVVNVIYPSTHLVKLLCRLGMSEYSMCPAGGPAQNYEVLLDGRVVGWLPDAEAGSLTRQLRHMKVLGLEGVPRMCEICLVPRRRVAAQYPCLHIFTGPARLMRPVQNLAYNTIEMLGTFEQVYMDICVSPSEAIEGLTTHSELHDDIMLSVVASLTPYSNYNQSPRNMYQCQMGKQTMGTPLHAYRHRADNKLYRIITPQTPIVRPHWHEHYNIDEYPLGMNAVVAVISYTGYDMEDAMILNKSSYERGFGHGCIYKSEVIDLTKDSKEGRSLCLSFGHADGGKEGLDLDGLPPVGTLLTFQAPYYSYVNEQTGDTHYKYYRSQEPAFVEQIKILADDQKKGGIRQVCIVLRIIRNPVIGDKFSSRHGQKGICSQLWPVENMPFSESGMTPDIIFNPHGFPSRMTIGMMIESMAGKSAAMHGLCHDATPFTFTEEEPPIDYFGRLLSEAGYNYYGTERFYSGADGREMEANIFMGIVYYQRLRHMVSDKFQVRTTGPIDNVTHQPVKGRKRAGGIRFGEMERDALLSHGTSFLLQDRLLNCSDRCELYACSKCGSLLSASTDGLTKNSTVSGEAISRWRCRSCTTTDTVQLLTMPYVFKYLVTELAAMNIKVTLDIARSVGAPTVL